MIIKQNLHLKSLKRFRVSEGRNLEKGLRLDRNEKVDNWIVYPWEKVNSDTIQDYLKGDYINA